MAVSQILLFGLFVGSHLDAVLGGLLPLLYKFIDVSYVYVKSGGRLHICPAHLLSFIESKSCASLYCMHIFEL